MGKNEKHRERQSEDQEFLYQAKSAQLIPKHSLLSPQVNSSSTTYISAYKKEREMEEYYNYIHLPGPISGVNFYVGASGDCLYITGENGQ